MNNEELVPVMSSVGWFVVETIERMQDNGFDNAEIMVALDLPTEAHLTHMLIWAERERNELVDGFLPE